MPGTKRLIIIHGRATKPSEKEKKRLVRKCLLHGLERVRPAAATRLRRSKVKYNFIYYGDINNREIIKRSPDKETELTGRDEKHGGMPCEPAGSYDDDLATMFMQMKFDKRAYKKFLKDVKDRRFFDETASVVSVLAGMVGLSDNVIRKATPDMGAYLMSRKVGSEIRERLQRVLKPALKNNEDICLVSHSMGCIVSYDVLWKFSQMSEYRDVRNSGNRVSLWLTLGNPLGEPGVRDNLYDAHEPEDGMYPVDIINQWMNIAARDDFVSHDGSMKDDFAEMKDKGLVGNIRDLPEIYTFWRGTHGVNPHKLYGYLDHPKVAGQIANWMMN
ncbi:MAG: hypothetical protein EP297_10765 [Gammaproteobacteria bacterium]|nr:MAG: hypothetical protein EP297_10765 [Gammaproteobacteria bacterium]